MEQPIERVVIKIGSNLLSHDNGIDTKFFRRLAEEVEFLTKNHIQVVIVSSGAVGTAMSSLQKKLKPQTISEKQALAALGQPLLMQQYIKYFEKKSLRVGQILLTHSDFENRTRFLNSKHAIFQLLEFGAIPIVNENDTVSVDELKFGDNDRLSALVAQLIDGDLLIILSDIEGLYTGNPKKDPKAELITHVDKVDKKIQNYLFESKTQKSTGGMLTKLEAAKIAMSYGIPMIITSGHQTRFIQKIFSKTYKGTYFHPEKNPLTARKNWIHKILKEKGSVVIDDGAKKALLKQNTSLLPSGVMKVSGKFKKGDCISILDESGVYLAKGLVNYDFREVEKIKGKKSSEIFKTLGYKDEDELIHRDDLVVL